MKIQDSVEDIHYSAILKSHILKQIFLLFHRFLYYVTDKNYKRAKSVVKLIHDIRNKIIKNEDLNKKINVYFLEDYNVTNTK